FAAALAVVFVIPSAGVGLFGPPGQRWKGAIPTLALARIAPLSNEFLCNSWLDQELVERFKRKEVSPLATRWTLNRYFAAYPNRLQSLVTTRSRWPVDTPITVAVNDNLDDFFDPMDESTVIRTRLLSTPDGVPGMWAYSTYEGSFDKPLGVARAGDAI